MTRLFKLSVALLMGLTLQAATVVFDNTAAISDGFDPVASYFGPLYDSFSTLATPGVLSSAEFVLTGDNTSNASTTVRLYSNSANAPGSLIAILGTISDSLLSANGSLINLNLTSTPLLAASTRYWIGLVGPVSSLMWNFSFDDSGIGVAGEYFQNSNGTLDDTNGPYQMQIQEASPTPEPATLLLASCGLLAVLRRKR